MWERMLIAFVQEALEDLDMVLDNVHKVHGTQGIDWGDGNDSVHTYLFRRHWLQLIQTQRNTESRYGERVHQRHVLSGFPGPEGKRTNLWPVSMRIEPYSKLQVACRMLHVAFHSLTYPRSYIIVFESSQHGPIVTKTSSSSSSSSSS